jgi:drug/metabolite transporter (DMT)-like permease
MPARQACLQRSPASSRCCTRCALPAALSDRLSPPAVHLRLRHHAHTLVGPAQVAATAIQPRQPPVAAVSSASSTSFGCPWLPCQVVIKAVIVVSTAALSQLLLRKRLRRGQWGLLLLLLGGVGCATPDLGSLPRKMAESTLRGLGLAVGASLCFAAQAVYFELVSSESASAARQSVHWQNVQASACGVVANLLLLALLGGGGGHEGPSDDGHGGMICIGLGSRALVAVCAVAATDISSNIAFKQLGANAYSFVRGSSFVLSALISAVFLGERPPEGATGPWTLRFWLGALMVLSASELFARSERGRKLPIAHFTQAASTD